MPFNIDQLRDLDARGYRVIEALAHDGRSSSTFSRPASFVCIDGRTYWVKRQVQQGLVAELVAGRLAVLVEAGPSVQIIRVSAEALPADGSLAHLQGIAVGSQDLPDTVNARELEPLLQAGQLRAGSIDPYARARVVAFHTWLEMRDAQVLIRLTDGAVFSIDHGDCFADTSRRHDPDVIVVPIPGITGDVGRAAEYVEPAIRRLERVSDRNLISAVAQVPLGEPWRSPVQRRLEIAEWLSYRRGRLREVMERWTS